MKLKTKILTLTASVAMTMPMISMVSCGKKEEQNQGLMYNLDFADLNHLGKNSANTDYEDAKLEGSASKTGTWKEHNAIKFNDENSYFALPSKLLANQETVTISLWTKESQSDRGDIFSFTDGNQTMSLSLHGGYLQWNAFDLKLYDKNGQVSHLITPKTDIKARGISPQVGSIQSTIGTWQLVAVTFEQSGLTIYVNGRKIKVFDGDYSFANKNINQFVLGTNLATRDEEAESFEGDIADVKIYNQALTEQDITNEYNISYKDFLTTDFEFNEGTDNYTTDEVRGLKGVFGGDGDYKAKIKKEGDRTILDLGAIDGTLEETPTSWLDLPNQTFFGHNELTISADLYVRQARPNSRLFSVGAYTNLYPPTEVSDLNRYFDIFAGYGYLHEDGCRMKLESVENSSVDVLPIYLRQAVHNDTTWYPIKEWFNVTYTIKPKGAIMYIDGTPVCFNDDFIYNPGNLWNYHYGNELACVIGRTYGAKNYSLDAMIDNFKMYSVALTPKEVAQENHHEVIEDDEQAVQSAIDNFNTLPQYSETWLKTRSFNKDNVEIICKSKDWSVVDANGNVFPSDKDRTCDFIITVSRNNVTKTFEKTFRFNKTVKPQYKTDGVGLDHAQYTPDEENNRYYKAMKYNADDMFLYDPERFLVNYRKIAGMRLVQGYDKGYGGWIRQHRGGEGQFETFYIGALARLTQSMPDYESQGAETLKTPVKRCRYMMEELQKCQDHFALVYPDDAGYLGAIPLVCFDALVHGVRRGQIPGSEWINWVPWYMYHKNLRMCYDVYTFYVGEDAQDTQYVRNMAYQMLKKASLWVYNKTKNYTDRERFDILSEEYGGIAEALYLAYGLVRQNEPQDLDSANKIFMAARFFQETDVLVGSYNDINVYSPRHVNSTIPKYLACCAEYQITGDPFYLQAAEHFFDWMDNHMSYADGGLGVVEFYENADQVTQRYESNETCCCYNMLRLADYLFKFTGNAKYARYFEKVFYNHIMGGINTDNVELVQGKGEVINAGKVYSMPTAFGYHKIYSNQRAREGAEAWEDGAFWCCCCSGQETFTKLTYGNFYIDQEDDSLYINMYNPISLLNNNGDAIVTLSGDDLINNKTENTINLDLTNVPNNQKIHLIKPKWAESMTVTCHGQDVGEEGEDYITITVGQQGIQQTDQINIAFTKGYYFVKQRGFETKEYEGKTYHSNCLFFGPTMLVANLGIIEDEWNEYVEEASGEVRTHANFFKYIYNTEPKSYQEWVDEGKVTNPISQYNSVNYGSESPISYYVKAKQDDNYNHELTIESEVPILFSPFMNIKYEYYSMYMYYHFNDNNHF